MRCLSHLMTAEDKRCLIIFKTPFINNTNISSSSSRLESPNSFIQGSLRPVHSRMKDSLSNSLLTLSQRPVVNTFKGIRAGSAHPNRSANMLFGNLMDSATRSPVFEFSHGFNTDSRIFASNPIPEEYPNLTREIINSKDIDKYLENYIKESNKILKKSK